MSGKAPHMISVAIAAVSVAAGVWGSDGPMTVLSLIAVILSVTAFAYCSDTVLRFSLTASMTVLVCTLVMVTVASHDSLVGGGTMTEYSWTFIAAAVRGAAVLPLILLFYFAAAAAFRASYNWVSAGGLAWLIGLGMQVPMFVLLFLIEVPGPIDSVLGNEPAVDIISNASIVIGLFLSLMMFLIFSLVLANVFRKNRYLITANGLEVRP